MKVLPRRAAEQGTLDESTPMAGSPALGKSHVSLPKVDLLPSSIRSKVAITRIRRWATTAFVALVVAGAGLWWMQTETIQVAQRKLDQAQETNIELNNEVQRLSPIAELTNQLEDQNELISTALAANPKAESIIKELQASGADIGVSFSTVSVTVSGLSTTEDQAFACPRPDPFSDTPLVGCISFSGFAPDRGAVAQLLNKLQAEPMFDGPFLSSSTTTASTDKGSLVALTGTVGLTPDALMSPPTAEELEELLNPEDDSTLDEEEQQ